MKKAVIILSVVFAVIFVALIVIIVLLFVQMQTQLSPQVQQVQQAPAVVPPPQEQLTTTEEELAAELAELRNQLQELLANEPLNQIITENEAENIALAFLGFGTVADSMLFIGEEGYTFEVEIINENVRYIVYVDAVVGNVIRMGRFDDLEIAE